MNKIKLVKENVVNFLQAVIWQLQSEGCTRENLIETADKFGYSRGGYVTMNTFNFIRYKFKSDYINDGQTLKLNKVKYDMDSLADSFIGYIDMKAKQKAIANKESRNKTSVVKSKKIEFLSRVFFMEDNFITKGTITSMSVDSIDSKDIEYIVTYKKSPTSEDTIKQLTEKDIFLDAESLVQYLRDNIK